jgi:hypothetical protein
MGARMRVRSKRYQALTLKRRERERRLAADRLRSHGELANRILGQAPRSKPQSCPIKRGDGSATARALRFAPPTILAITRRPGGFFICKAVANQRCCPRRCRSQRCERDARRRAVGEG